MRAKTLPFPIIACLVLLGSTALLVSIGRIAENNRGTREESSFVNGRPSLDTRPETSDKRRVTSDVQEIERPAAGPYLVSPKVLARATLRKRNRSPYAAAVTPSFGTTTPYALRPTPDALLPIVNHPDILPKHQKIADEVFRKMPERCVAALRNFYVRYDHPKERGLAGKESIVLSGNVPDQEFRALLIHEFGHVMDLGCIQGTPRSTPTVFRDGNETIWSDDPSVLFYTISWIGATAQKRETKPEDFVTGYASWDAFEDFAESIAYYVLQQDAFRARAATNGSIRAKLAWIETYLFPSGIAVAKGDHTWHGTVPWDATKLPYVWGKSDA